MTRTQAIAKAASDALLARAAELEEDSTLTSVSVEVALDHRSGWPWKVFFSKKTQKSLTPAPPNV